MSIPEADLASALEAAGLNNSVGRQFGIPLSIRVEYTEFEDGEPCVQVIASRFVGWRSGSRAAMWEYAWSTAIPGRPTLAGIVADYVRPADPWAEEVADG